MTNKTSRTTFKIGFAIGFLIGAAVALVFVFVQYVGPARRDVADLYVGSIQRNIRACELILEGKTNAARRKLEDDLLVTAAGIQDAFSNHPGAQYHLWQIATYFSTNHLTPTGMFSNNVSGISLSYPSNSPAAIYYWQSNPSYVESIMKRRGPE